MVIEITVDSGKWLRADLVDGGQKPFNLYHIKFHTDRPIITQYESAISSVKFNFPQYKDVRIVTDLGSQTCSM